MKFFESLFADNFNDNPDYFKLIRIFEIFLISFRMKFDKRN